MKHATQRLILCALALALAGCGGTPAAPAATTAPMPTAPLPATVPAEPAPTAEPAAVKLYYEGNAQFELISPAGARVLIDVYDPKLLSGPATPQDVLLTTHSHSDHVNSSFMRAFAGPQLDRKTGDITLSDVTIHGLASAHNATDPLKPEGGTNYLFVIDVAGLRVVHFGDIGQEAFTDEQLAALGQVDVALTQLANSYSAMDATNQKGFKLMDQLQPRLVVVTHVNLDAVKFAGGHWPCLYSDRRPLAIAPANLPESTTCLFLKGNGTGDMADAYRKILNLPELDW